MTDTGSSAQSVVTPARSQHVHDPENSIPVIASATGHVIGHVPEAGVVGVDAAVLAARDAAHSWSRTTPSERSHVMLRMADVLRDNAQELAELESANTGRPVAAALIEMDHAADAFSYYAGAIRNLQGKAAMEYTKGKTSFIRMEPIGVCAQFTSWNYPLMMVALAIAPALVAGNTSILKPSELAPLTALRFAELVRDVLPAGVLNIVTGGPETGKALTAHPDVDLVSVIGSVDTGKAITRSSADTLKRLHLELGGKAPVIVFDDANLHRAIENLKYSCFWNAGQDCTAAARILVHDSVSDAFISEFVTAVRSLVVGAPDDEGAEIGPVISERQMNNILAMVERAQAAGGKIATGGKRVDRAGWFLEPTVIVDPAQDSEIVQEEVFGPVVTIQRFNSPAEAIELANDVRFGLASSVWSDNPARLFNTAYALDFGNVWLNDHFPQVMEMPHGGFKQSGTAKDQSMYSLEEYVRIKHLMLDLDGGEIVH